MTDLAKHRREIILQTIIDLTGELLYYARKEDEELPVGAIEKALEAGEITVDEMVATFEEHLREWLDP